MSWQKPLSAHPRHKQHRVRLKNTPALPPEFTEFVPDPESVLGPVATTAMPTAGSWEANPKQALFINSRADEIFYGGAKGGGKSVALLGDFLNFERKHGNSAKGILFRRTYGEFLHLRKQAAEMFAGVAAWSGEFNMYTFPSGATLRLGNLAHQNHLTTYTGNEYCWMGFDELPEWPAPDLFLWMFTCLRSTDPNVRTRVVATGNPGRPGHGWVKQRYIDDRNPYEIYKNPKTGKTRCFIPARLEDNPQLFLNSPDYDANLREQNDIQTYKALRFGDWNVFVGQAFDEWDPEWHTRALKDVQIGIDWPRFVTCDWGYREPYAILYFAVSPIGRVYCYHESYGCEEGEDRYNIGVRRTGFDVATDEFTFASREGINQVTIDTQAKDDQGTGTTVADQWQMAGWSLLDAKKDRAQGKQAVHRLLQTPLEDGLPMLQVTQNCRHLIRTLPSLVYDDRAGHHEEVDDTGECHLYDALRFFAMQHDLMPGSPRLRRQQFQLDPQRARRRWNPYESGSNWDPYGNHRLAA